MSEATLLVGNVYDRLEDVDTDSVDLLLTSPPFWSLRSYLDDDDPNKALEIGQEASPGEYLDSILRVVAGAARPLAPWGSIAIEIGDTYFGAGGAGGDYSDTGQRAGQNRFKGSAARAKGNPGAAYPPIKSLCMIPTLFAASLAYGVNMLTGEPSPAGKWIVRNVVVWARPNPAVGELFDKFRPSTSYLTIATRARDRYCDIDAVRVPNKSKMDPNLIGKVDGRERARAAVGLSSGNGFTGVNEGGTPPNDFWLPWPVEEGLWDWWQNEVWEIPTRPYAGSHYAVWPPALCVRPIKALCPERVCTECDTPSTRIVKRSEKYEAERSEIISRDDPNTGMLGYDKRGTNMMPSSDYETIGWTDCGHDSWRRGCVLDPFAGSGTTLAVATGHNRDAIGIDLDQRNADLCRERIGLFLRDIVLPLKDVPPTIVDVEGSTMEEMFG